MKASVFAPIIGVEKPLQEFSLFGPREIKGNESFNLKFHNPKTEAKFKENTGVNFSEVKEYYKDYDFLGDWIFKYPDLILCSDDLKSTQLALWVLPSIISGKSNFDKICLTGFVEKEGSDFVVREPGKIKEKFDLVLKDFSKKHQDDRNCRFAFIYISDKDLQLTKTDFLTIKRFSPGLKLSYVISWLSNGFHYTFLQKYRFQDEVYFKLNEHMNGSYNLKIFLSPVEGMDLFYDSRFLYSIERSLQNPENKVGVDIFIVKSLNMAEISSDYNRDENYIPKWQQQLQNCVSSYDDIKGMNLELTFLHNTIENDLLILRNKICNTLGYKNGQEKRRLMIRCHSVNPELSIKGNKISSQSALLLECSDGNTFFCYSHPTGLYYLQTNNLNDLPEISELEIAYHYFKNKKINAIKNGAIIQQILTKIEDKRSISELDEYELFSINLLLPKFHIYSLPACGKTSVLALIAKKLNRQIINTDVMINFLLFDDSIENFKTIKGKMKLPRGLYSIIPSHVIYSRSYFDKLCADKSQVEKIRYYAAKIALIMDKESGNKTVIDFGGKSRTSPIFDDLRNEGYISIFLNVEGENEEEVFENYYRLYVDNPDLCNSGRRNILDLALIDDDGKLHKTPQTDTRVFKEKLYNRIFKPRYEIYNSKMDCTVVRKKDQTVDNLALEVIRAVLKEEIKRDKNNFYELYEDLNYFMINE